MVPVRCAGLLVLVLSLGCAEWDQPAREAEPAPAETSASSPEAPAPPAEPLLIRSEHEITPGEGLDLALRRLELDPDERLATVSALKGADVDPRRVLPGEVLSTGRTPEGQLREVALQRDVFEAVVVHFHADSSVVADVERRDPEVHVRRLEGVLQGSLYEAMLAAGSDDNLTMRYADLLGWQVDFLTEPRNGDQFRLVVREEFLDGERLGYGKILSAEYRGVLASARALRYVDSEGTLDWYDDEGKSVRRAFLKSPLSYRRISSGFSSHRRHPILKTVRPHWGVDYAAPTGTPVSALGDGVVQFAGRKGGYGNYLEVRHSSTYTTCYAHLSRFAKGMRSGQRVEQGQVIGYVGSTGLSTGPHLDFRVKRNGSFVNPLTLDAPPGREIATLEKLRFEGYRDRAWELTDALDAAESVPEADAWDRIISPMRAEEVMAWSTPGSDALARDTEVGPTAAAALPPSEVAGR
jgi:murein DD-endopeptidase MepM/ murein hydrolase activator NlpD